MPPLPCLLALGLALPARAGGNADEDRDDAHADRERGRSGEHRHQGWETGRGHEQHGDDKVHGHDCHEDEAEDEIPVVVGAGTWGVLVADGADATLLGEAPGDRASQGEPGIAGAGDLDGDGFDDVLVGALFAGGDRSGAVYVLRGPLEGTRSLGAGGVRIAGPAPDATFGGAVLGLGDADGDGLDDVVISAPGDGLGGERAGRMFVFEGPVSGGVRIDQAWGEIVGARAFDLLSDPARVGDVDGDGLDDLLVGAQYSDVGGPDAGAVWLLHGPLSGVMDLAAIPPLAVGAVAGDEAGSALASAGDADGDGLPDVLIGARFSDAGGTASGQACVVPADAAATVALDQAIACYAGPHADAWLGWGISLAGGGDLDEDGYDDLVLGVRNDSTVRELSGAAYVVRGPVVPGQHAVTEAAAVLLGEADRDLAGDSVDMPGDVDGDGVPDVLVGSGYADGAEPDGGAVYLVRGPVPDGATSLGDADAVLSAAGSNDRLRGHGAGDVNGDGRADVLLGAMLSDLGGEDAGAAFLFYGTPLP